MSIRTVSVRLQAEISGYINRIRQAGAATRDFANNLERHSRSVDELTSTAAHAGLVLAGGFLLVASRAAAFDKAMDGVAAATQAGAVDMQRLSDAALEAGKATLFTAGEAAKAEEELAKAGVSVQDMLSGGLQGALDLAAAGQMEVGEAAEYAASAMTQFSLSGKDLPHVADLLAATAGKAQGEVKDVGDALKMAGLVASQFGLSIEETTGAIAAFASAGLVGSDAGTSFKTMLLRLAAPAGDAADLMKQLDISAYDASGQFVGMTAFAGQLQDALAGMTTEQRNSTLSIIFGADAIRAANVLYTQGAKGMSDWINKVNDAGFAADVAAQKTDNLAGDVDKLVGSLDTLAIEAGGGVNEGLRGITQRATSVVDAIGKIPPSVTSTATVLVGMGGAALLAVAGFVKIVSKVRETRQAFNDLQISGGRASRTFVALSKGLGAVAVALTATNAIGAAAGKQINPQIEGLALALDEYGKTGRIAGEMSRILAGDVDNLGGAFVTMSDAWYVQGLQIAESISGLGDVVNGVTKDHERIAALDTALATMVQSGHLDQAKLAYGALLTEAGKYGVTIEQFQAAMPQYMAAITGVNAKTAEQTEATKQEKVARDLANNSLTAAIDLYGSLQATYDAMNGKVLNFREAQRQAEQAIDDVKEALDASNGSLSIHSDKGRAAATAVDGMAKAAINAAQKKYEETGSIKQANEVYDSYIGQLRATMRQAGLSKGEIDKLIKKIASMPAYKSTKVEVKINYVETGFGNSAYAQYFGGGRVQVKRWGGVTEYARSGLLSDAEVYRAGQSPMYGFAEPQTGGEAFVPKNGDYDRSMSILAHAAGWYGARVVPAGWSASSGGEMTVRIIVDGTGVLTGLRKEITARSGDVQRELGRGQRRP